MDILIVGYGVVGANVKQKLEKAHNIDVVDNKANYYVIKSTILPGTTDYIAKYTKKNVVFSPEFYGGTQHCNNFDFDFTILGGAKKDCIEVQ